jgi:hypothetical protein
MNRRTLVALILILSGCTGLISTLSSSPMITEGTTISAVAASFNQAEPRLRETGPSGMAFQPTAMGRLSTVLAAHTASGTSMRTKRRFQGSAAPLAKCARVSHAAKEIEVAAQLTNSPG